MRTRLQALALTAMLAFGLAACTDDPVPIIEPSPTDTPTAPPTETGSSTPSTPTDDPDPEPESAKDFIRRWQAETFAMQNSGDTGTYLAMTMNCDSCKALAASVKAIYADGGSVVGSGGSIEELVRVGGVDGVSIFEYLLSSNASKVLNDDGSVDQRFSGGTNRYQVNVESFSQNWRVRSVSRITE